MKKHFMYRKKPGENELMFSLCGCIMEFENDWLKPSESIDGVTCKRCLATYRRDMEEMIDDLYMGSYGTDTPVNRLGEEE